MFLIAERSRANKMWQLIKWRTCENDIFSLSDRMSAILLKQMVHSLAIPPVDAKTRGDEGSMLNFSYPLSIQRTLMAPQWYLLAKKCARRARASLLSLCWSSSWRLLGFAAAAGVGYLCIPVVASVSSWA